MLDTTIFLKFRFRLLKILGMQKYCNILEKDPGFLLLSTGICHFGVPKTRILKLESRATLWMCSSKSMIIAIGINAQFHSNTFNYLDPVSTGFSRSSKTFSMIWLDETTILLPLYSGFNFKKLAMNNK